jgi:hypothetical protein
MIMAMRCQAWHTLLDIYRCEHTERKQITMAVIQWLEYSQSSLVFGRYVAIRNIGFRAAKLRRISSANKRVWYKLYTL